ncbi:MAG: HK97 family phage prohead protease [Chromatiales bacterium]|nr:HK97 family phage prohead protease [Chromatiales bacterium]
MSSESRAALEFRVTPDGRGVSGTALRYGDTAVIAGGVRERFEAGAFSSDSMPEIRLNLQHSRTNVSGPVVWADGPYSLEFRADNLEEGVVNLIRRGAIQAASVEFRAVEEDRADGERVIRRAELTGLALVDQGAYPDSRIELRHRRSDGRRRWWL